MVNRLLASEVKIREKIETLDAKGIGVLEESTKLSFEEIAFFQQLKSTAQMKGLITTEEALTIYNALMRWDEVELPLRVSLTVGLAQLAGLET